ncbi:thiol protease SEN102 [Brachypodium distachyon]|uniref:thiol protease SEN102 n=1 Tax=Brachypodium distachyon TaxID=15368 RepID=UPI00052FEAF1|nr:thiol protease SEN102 [Brachypodium distachyon]|eukprot:XP_010233001.1 thiol protease SEN102 [Brachypodium distachyon]
MAVAGVLLLLLAAQASAMDFGESDLASGESQWALYQRWRVQDTDMAMSSDRFTVFVENAHLVHDFNARRDAPYKLWLNGFADLTAEEFSRAYASSRVYHLEPNDNVWVVRKWGGCEMAGPDAEPATERELSKGSAAERAANQPSRKK